MHNIVKFSLKCLSFFLSGDPVEKQTDERSCGCHGNCCEVCTFLEGKNTFTNKKGSDILYKIGHRLHVDCNSENAIYLSTCEKCK